MSSSLPPPQSPLRPASAAAAAAASNGHAAIPAPPPTAADQAKQLQLAARLRDKGLKRLLHSRQPISERADASDMKRGRYPAAVFPPGKSVDLALKSAGAKGATAAKHRFLFHMPFRFSCRASGRQIGWLCHMNTRNPVMYIQFPIGRVKLFGTVMRSNNVFLAVPYSLGKRAANDQLSVRGTFDRIVAFTEWRWIGKKEDNPEEHELPVPDELSVAPRKAGTLNLGGSMPQSSGSGSQVEGDEAAAAAAHDDDAGIIDLVEGEGDDEETAAAAAAPKARRKRESKPLVLGGSSDDDADDAEDDGSQVRTPSRKRKSTGGASSSKRKKRRIDSDGDDSEGEEEEEGSDASAGPDDDAADESDIPQSQSSNRPRRASTANKISYVDRIVVDDSEDEVAEEEEGEEEVAAADSDDEDFE